MCLTFILSEEAVENQLTISSGQSNRAKYKEHKENLFGPHTMVRYDGSHSDNPTK